MTSLSKLKLQTGSKVLLLITNSPISLREVANEIVKRKSSEQQIKQALNDCQFS